MDELQAKLFQELSLTSDEEKKKEVLEELNSVATAKRGALTRAAGLQFWVARTYLHTYRLNFLRKNCADMVSMK